jgi:tRNA A-37 threonylcarbamoyl transferase component Bud32
MPDPLTRLQAALADRYTVQRELGRGGMATVYLAQDLKHHRLVAIKILRPELAATLSRERFLREIEVAAGLDHPHILPLHDSGEADGLLYYVMPYVDGGSLRSRLDQEKQLRVEDALRITEQVAGALGYAHSRGVIHRDIKPENLLLAPGGARVADFGIARAIAVAAGENLTGTGVTVGTPAYMSPEQAAGSEELDGRSDLYSLGCVLYEMLAGEPPFTGSNPQSVIAKRWTEPAPLISRVREVPPGVEQALDKVLAAMPADRFDTADRFATALAGPGVTTPAPARAILFMSRRRVLRWGSAALALAAVVGAAVLWSRLRHGTPATVDANVVAVLPFRVTSPDSGDNYLREGIVDLLNARLTGDGLPRAVDTRTTLSAWRRAVAAEGGELTTSRALAVAQGLGAGQLFLGEFVATPSRMTVSGRLLRVPKGELVAEHSEVARVGEVDELALVDRWLGRIIATTVGEGSGRLPQLSDSMAAVKAYLAGLRAHRRGEYAMAATQYQRSLEIDSTFALPAYWLAVVSQWLPSGELVLKAGQKAWSLRDRLNSRDRVQLAAEWGVGPNYPEPYTTTELIQAAERAADVSPDRPEALERVAGYLLTHGAASSIEGWLPRATVALDSAIRLDSGYVAALWTRLFAALLGGNPEDILRIASLYFARSPTADNTVTHWLVAQALHDSAALAEAGMRLSYSNVLEIASHSPGARLPLDDLDRAVAARFARSNPSSGERCELLTALLVIGAVRGELARATALADSANMAPDCGARWIMIPLALADPGYGRTVNRYAQELTAIPEADAGPEQVCWAELWHVSQGDTTRTRRAIGRIKRLVRDRDPVPLTWVGRLGVCPLVLEAAVEAIRRASGAAPSLARLDSLMRQGTGLELPGNLANLLLARWLEARGDLPGALAAVRRRVHAWNFAFTMLYPAYLREEGRLAAVTGDTAGAIRAYHDYLTLRDEPDPGPMQEEVRRVKADLAELVAEKAGR